MGDLEYMKSVETLVALHNTLIEARESSYVDLRTSIQRQLEKAMAIKGAIASYEMKLQRATIEFEEELETISNNFNQA